LQKRAFAHAMASSRANVSDSFQVGTFSNKITGRGRKVTRGCDKTRCDGALADTQKANPTPHKTILR